MADAAAPEVDPADIPTGTVAPDSGESVPDAAVEGT
jgi:hypothetical protein